MAETKIIHGVQFVYFDAEAPTVKVTDVQLPTPADLPPSVIGGSFFGPLELEFKLKGFNTQIINRYFDRDSRAAYKEAAVQILAMANLTPAHLFKKRHMGDGAEAMAYRLFRDTGQPRILMKLPVRSADRLHTLAHEVGHIALRHQGSSRPVYIVEYEAEIWALEALRKIGFLTSTSYRRAQEYILMHCKNRQRSADGHFRSWARHICEWCGFDFRDLDPEGRCNGYFDEQWKDLVARLSGARSKTD